MENSNKQEEKVLQEFNRLLSYYIHKIEFWTSVQKLPSEAQQSVLQTLKRYTLQLSNQPGPSLHDTFQKLLTDIKSIEPAELTDIISDLLEELELFQMRHNLEENYNSL